MVIMAATCSARFIAKDFDEREDFLADLLQQAYQKRLLDRASLRALARDFDLARVDRANPQHVGVGGDDGK